MTPRGALGTFRGANGRIAFVRDGKVFTIQPDGSDRRPLTPTGGNRAFPRWSPDGLRIAFGRFRRGRGVGIFVMRVNGTGVRRISPSSKRFVGPVAWRPGSSQALHVVDTSHEADPRRGRPTRRGSRSPERSAALRETGLRPFGRSGPTAPTSGT